MAEEANKVEETAETKGKMFSMKDFAWFLVGFLVGIIIGYVVFVGSMNISTEEITTTSSVQVEAQS